MIFDRGKQRMKIIVICTVILFEVVTRGMSEDGGAVSGSSDITSSVDNSQSETPPGSTTSMAYITDDTPNTTVEWSTTNQEMTVTPTQDPEYLGYCPSNVECSKLGGECIDCDMNNKTNCSYGQNMSVSCRPKPHIVCLGSQTFTRWMECQYCYQVPSWQQKCSPSTECRVVSSPRERYRANCTIESEILCLGRRKFHKYQLCNWTSGKRWSTALILSITVGGFGVDRFYLGLWKEGIGKLFSFGGLGVWTLVDVVLIATGYVGPADGSLYIF